MTVNKPCCIDIYDGNNVSDSPTPLAGFNQAASDGIFVVIHKSSEGVGYADRRYAARRPVWMDGPNVTLTDVDGSVLSLPRRWGAYHFFHGASEASAITEAQFFLKTAALTSLDEPFIDWEAVGTSGYQPSAVIADAFCKTVEDAIGRACWVYSGNVARERLPSADVETVERFANRPLWFCQYGVYQPRLLPNAWKQPILWQDDGDQYGPGPHTIPGIESPCDNSTVVGTMTVAALAAAWGAPPAPAAETAPVATAAPAKSLWRTLMDAV